SRRRTMTSPARCCCTACPSPVFMAPSPVTRSLIARRALRSCCAHPGRGNYTRRVYVNRLRLPTTLASDLWRRHLVTVGSVWRIALGNHGREGARWSRNSHSNSSPRGPERRRGARCSRAMALCLLRADLFDGGGRRRHAAHFVRPIDHRVAAGGRRRAAAVRRGLVRRLRNIPRHSRLSARPFLYDTKPYS